MFDKLEGVEKRFAALERLLSNPEIVKDQEAYRKYTKEHAELNKIVSAYREYKQVTKDISESKELLKDSDEEIKELAKEDLQHLEEPGPALVVRRPGFLPQNFLICTVDTLPT
jgi:peptide chain release factor 1